MNLEDFLRSADVLITLAAIPVLLFFLVWVYRYMRWTQEEIQRVHDSHAAAAEERAKKSKSPGAIESTT